MRASSRHAPHRSGSSNGVLNRCGRLCLCTTQIQAVIGAAPYRCGRPLRAPYRYGSHSARATQIQAGIGARHTDAGGRCVRHTDMVATQL